MRQSTLFLKTQREAPKDETAVNAKLLIKAGFIHKVMAGVYEYLPLGFRVLQKINAIIREEMNATGAEELHLSVLQSKETWATSGRWDLAKDVMYQFKDASGKEVGLGWTHEEPLTLIATQFIHSYHDLPKAVYQIQTKFRNEPRAKAGLIRGREFLMKDLYSFHADEHDLDRYYETVAEAYLKIFTRLGLDAKRTVASGGLFSKFSDEFQVFSASGEDTVFYCGKCGYTANKDVAEQLKLGSECPECNGALKSMKSIEVGNIFKLGTMYSEAFGLLFTDTKGEKKPVIMASYGIGPGRCMGTIVEVHHDEKGLVWPDAVAPFAVHLVKVGADKETLTVFADGIYHDLTKKGIEVLYDDREDVSAGEKFADADLIGIPWRVVVSERTEAQGKVEVKRRQSTDAKLMKLSELLSLLRK
ncbi:MAG: aminoacyl--tRNA ligase-related protein [Candidatus Jorgensenbacteria bacterium]|nr:aminoacyl--tRNA ligase-related protein [Candidatus Jorgensenbacteria bacterium]